MKKTVIIGILLIFSLAITPIANATITVDDDGTSDFDSIQAAINSAPKTRVEKELDWGDGLQDLSDPLEVSVSYEVDRAVFKAEMPEDYDPGEDLMTFAFDTDPDGIADFQIQYNRNNNGNWSYKTADQSGWKSWEEVPSEFVMNKKGYNYSLSMPISKLGGMDSSYKFGVDANDRSSSPTEQTFYSTDPSHLYYHESYGHVSSYYYVSMEVGDTIPATIEVSPGTYEETVNLNKEVKVTGSNSPESSGAAVLDGAIEVSAEDAVLKNMKIAPKETILPGGLDPHGILVTASGVLIENNVVEGMTGDCDPDTEEDTGSVTLNGIQVWSADENDPVEDVVIRDNVVRDMLNQGGSEWPNYGGAAAIKVQGVLNGTDVIGNKVENVYSAGWTYGIVTTHTENAPGISPKDTLVKGNTISKVNDGSKYTVSEDPASAPYPGNAFCVDGDSKANEVVVNKNNFLETPIGVQNKDGNVLDATNNYWGHASGPSGEDGRTNPAGRVVGKGAKVVGDVNWNPYLSHPVGKPRADTPEPPKKGPKVKSFSVTSNQVSSSQKVTFSAQGTGVDQLRVKVFNTTGAQVYDSNFQNGSTVSWNLVGDSGEKLANGLYLFALSAKVDGEVQKSEIRQLLVIN